MDEDRELMWMAGIIDGEGCIMINRIHRKGAGHPDYRMGININVVEGQDTSMFVKRFGGKLYLMKPPTERAKPYYAWTLYGEAALAVLRTLLPFLVWKREKAKLAIRFQERRVKRSRLSSEELDKMEADYQAMKALNFRGRRSSWELEESIVGGA